MLGKVLEFLAFFSSRDFLKILTFLSYKCSISNANSGNNVSITIVSNISLFWARIRLKNLVLRGWKNEKDFDNRGNRLRVICLRSGFGLWKQMAQNREIL